MKVKYVEPDEYMKASLRQENYGPPKQVLKYNNYFYPIWTTEDKLYGLHHILLCEYPKIIHATIEGSANMLRSLLEAKYKDGVPDEVDLTDILTMLELLR